MDNKPTNQGGGTNRRTDRKGRKGRMDVCELGGGQGMGVMRDRMRPRIRMRLKTDIVSCKNGSFGVEKTVNSSKCLSFYF